MFHFQASDHTFYMLKFILCGKIALHENFKSYIFGLCNKTYYKLIKAVIVVHMVFLSAFFEPGCLLFYEVFGPCAQKSKTESKVRPGLNGI